MFCTGFIFWSKWIFPYNGVPDNIIDGQTDDDQPNVISVSISTLFAPGLGFVKNITKLCLSKNKNTFDINTFIKCIELRLIIYTFIGIMDGSMISQNTHWLFYIEGRGLTHSVIYVYFYSRFD